MTRAELRFIGTLWRPWWWVLAIILPLTLISTGIKAWLPTVLARAFDGLQGPSPAEAVAAAATLYFAVGGAEWLLTAGLMFTRGTVNVLFEWKTRTRAFSHLVRHGPAFLQRMRTGDLVTRLTDDVAEKLSWFLCSGIFRAVSASCIVVFALAMMARIDVRLTLLSAMPLPLLIVLHAFAGSMLTRRQERVQARISDLNGSLEACFAGVRVVKAYSREAAERAAFGEVAARCRDAEISAARAHVLLDSLYGHSFQAGIIAVLLAGGHAVLDARITLGEFLAFEAWVIMMSVPMLDLGNLLVRGRQSAVSIGRLLAIEAPEPDVREIASPRRIAGEARGSLRFEGVSLSLGDARRRVLEDVTFEAETGALVALVGRVGSGKSLLLRLPSRLLDPTEGRVTLDGIALPDLALSDLRRHVALVPQEPSLLSGTIRDNVRFDRPWVDEDTVRWAVRVARLDRDLGALAHGLDTKVGMRGVSLSGGQGQRVALARALAGRPRVLVLDDVTSALDAQTEAALWDELGRELPGLTLLVATHRTRTLERADRILVLEHGRVAQAGRHADLAARAGAYRDLYRHHAHEERATE